MRRVSPRCLALLKHFEGCRLEAYLDQVGVPTIGYGYTHGVALGMRISQQMAEDLLWSEAGAVSFAVESLFDQPLSDNELAALTSFAYNVGFQALVHSTLAKKLEAGDRAGAADEFLKWNHAGGKVVAGLTDRRQAERKLFLES